MTLLVTGDVLRARVATANAELAPLADGLLAELAPVMSRELYIPREKALLSRDGGRCPRDGATLAFDPFSPHRHRCPSCGNTYTGAPHDRFWIFWYQLWLAERAVHGAILANLRCDEPAASFAAAVLDRYADEYLLYPNRDNVLGPTRPFFSTYLESIWLLNLCIATDLLEIWRPQHAALGARVRERIVEPSAALIASYDEGGSNRQVWNDAALLAASRLLERAELGERALFGGSGVAYHLANGLLADGTWYEGENYHLFAHRGLWYGVAMAEASGVRLPPELLARFQEGFATPFLSSLPDMTLPSRRDSQYAISLRQSRFAELCELGLARQAGDGDARLRGVLHRLYMDAVPRRDTGRAQSTADVERNLPGTHLGRADLGWRSLLFARPALGPLESATLGSVLLGAQGLAVFRRASERVYVALDYGASGGGHGHPDRLNVLLSDGETRWLDDMGTGSYVDPSLHWYRSTLAHNAPLFNGYQQQRVDGELVGFDEEGEFGWVCARAFDLFPGVVASRTLVVTSEYFLDELVWQEPEPGVMDLPIHIDPATVTVRQTVPNETLRWYEGIAQLEDTLGVLRDQRGYPVGARTVARITTRDGERSLDGFVIASEPGILYRATAPGAPGKEPKPFLIMRVLAGVKTSWVRTVWSWSQDVEKIWLEPGGAFTAIERRDGSHDRLQHTPEGYSVERVVDGTRRTIQLAGLTISKSTLPQGKSRRRSRPFGKLRFGSPVVFELARDDYRRSEETWDEAGRPTAHLHLVCMPNELTLDVTVHKTGALTFVADGAVNPYDNEHADINGDGVQLYVTDRRGASAWMLVPEADGQGSVRVRVIDGSTRPVLDASWHPVDGGYAMSIRMPIELSPP
ncbi:MAG TPA: heparinase II/III family protein, partial [Gemmatimonadaceae bacterium]|nr:heparinase II/III family protein [Gemmatimonadaceae bacterium]